MRRMIFAGVFAGFAMAACRGNDSPAGPTSQPGLGAVVAAAPAQGPDKYIVVYRPSVSDARAEIARDVDPRESRVERVYQHALRGWAGELTPRELARLRNEPHVAFIERDVILHLEATQAPTPSWGLDRIDQNALPLNSSYTYNRTGAGVHFYSIDTGVLYTHNDFGGRASAGVDEIIPANGALDCNGHGTHTSSTAAGNTYGVAKAMTIVGVRVLGCGGSGPTSGVIAGIDWVTANAIKPAVANMSLGGGLSAALDQAVSNSIASGVVYAIAAGNSNNDACTGSPADVGAAITVAASDINDVRASFSSFGTCVDLFAPGVNITAAYTGSNSATALASGTSMATPHVAGVVGLYLEANPGATPAQVAAALVANATSNVIASPGAGSPNKLLYMGFIPGGGGGNQPPVAKFTFTCTGPGLAVNQCSFDGSTSTDDAGIVTWGWNWGDGRSETKHGPTTKNSWNPGTYTVTLTVTDGGGLTNSTSKQVVVGTPVNQAPTATITSPANNASFTQGASVSFAGSGNDPEDGALTGASLVWTSDKDGQIGTGTSFSKSNLSLGTHIITLTARDAQNLPGTAQRTITINPPGNQPPVADFTFNCNTGNPHQCSFDGSTSTDDVGIVSYKWNWDDGRTETHSRATANNSWSVSQIFNITLTVTDAGGLTSSITKAVLVP